MSIEDEGVIDFIGLDEGNTVVLTISNHLEWDLETLYKLQEKINRYFAFIESGEIYENYPDAKGKEVRINIVSKHQPSEEAEQMLEKFGSVAHGAGIQLDHEISF